MGYADRATAVPGAVLWRRTTGAAGARSRILPDGCLDLIWDGRRLFVAGPDSTARWHESAPLTTYVALRFAGGIGPALVGVPADRLRDSTPEVADLWPAATARELTEAADTDPEAALLSWLAARAAAVDIDPLGSRVLALARAGARVETMSATLGLGPRRLHRECLTAFGYGPRHLTRVLRLQRALAAAGAGAGLAAAAASSGFADQAHLCRDVRDLAGTTPTDLLRELRR